MADAPDSGSGVATRAGSSPALRTTILIGLLGCRSVAVPTNASPDASAPVVVGAGPAPAPAPALVDAGSFVGIWHSPVEPDEHNLVIEPGGTFFLEMYGCDYRGSSCGTWRATSSGLELVPAPPATTMIWPSTGRVDKVVIVTRGKDLESSVVGVTGPKTEAWLPGQVCAKCGGGLGPTGKLYPCNKPLTKSCP